MNIPKIETSRLVLRPFTDSDAAAACYNSKQQIVAHYMSDMVLETEDTALRWIHWLNNEKFNTGIPCVVLAVEVKTGRKCIGLIGIAPKWEIDNEVEILFSIADEYQNNGYATEAGKAIVWWAFEQAGQDVLSAIVKPENVASRRVIEKLGFIYGDTRTLSYDGADCKFDYFRLYHTDYLPCPEWDIRNLYKLELMGDFFKNRVVGYNDHMLSDGGDERVKQLGEAFPKTDEFVNILDLGCGTGIELDYIWAQIPNAHITCVDISSDMLALLVKNHTNRVEQITVIEASYFDWNYPCDEFDIVVSVQTMHHFEPEQKIGIYRSIHKALKPGGCYIESDFYVDTIAMEQYSRRYETIMQQVSERSEAGIYHIDIPNTIEIQRQLLSDAGFQTVKIVESHIRPRWSGGILKAGK